MSFHQQGQDSCTPAPVARSGTMRQAIIVGLCNLGAAGTLVRGGGRGSHVCGQLKDSITVALGSIFANFE